MKKGVLLRTLLSLAALVVPISGASGQARPGLHISLADPGPVGANTTTAVFSHFAIGGGYTTVFTLLNTGTGAATGNLILTGQDGSALSASLQSSDGTAASSSSIALNIPQGGATFVTAGPAVAGDPNVKAGWARVESSGGAPGGVSSFQLTSGGTLETIAGVLSSSSVSSATIPVDNDATAGRFTGYAIANTGSTNINVKVVVTDTNGNITDTVTPQQLNPLTPGHQVARFLHQDLPNRTTFRGSMVLIEQSGANFNVVALIQAQGISNTILFTAIPVIPGRAPNIN
ncbi:MAG TPA: hypothetical protein VE398_23850 [Acidobacteriota bacterium]|nr:hypothetical protein [Acidobacteriota bacterium]